MSVGLLILAVSLSVDALGIGFSYGMRKIKVPLGANIIILIISIFITSIAVLIGTAINEFLPDGMSQILGAGFLIFLGVWIIIQSFAENKPREEIREEKTLLHLIIKSLGITIKIIRQPETCDMDKSNCIEPREALYLAFALSVDSLGIGIASAALALNSLLIPITVGGFQIIFLGIGALLGRKISGLNINSKAFTLISGALLVVLGITRTI